MPDDSPLFPGMRGGMATDGRAKVIVITTMDKSGYDVNLQALAFLAKCLADENRLRILLCVSKGKKSVSGIVEELGLSQPLISHHLKELKRSLLVQVERSGPFVYYETADARILRILENLDGLGKDLLNKRTTF